MELIIKTDKKVKLYVIENEGHDLILGSKKLKYGFELGVKILEDLDITGYFIQPYMMGDIVLYKLVRTTDLSRALINIRKNDIELRRYLIKETDIRDTVMEIVKHLYKLNLDVVVKW